MDREAEFRRLYEAHRLAVHAYFTGRTADPQLSADLMQDVFLRAWQHLDRLTGLADDGQRAWIFTVARNLSIDARRHRLTREGAEQALAREPSRAPGAPGALGAHGALDPSQLGAPASAVVIAAERVAIVGEAIRRLPEQQRVALTMTAAGTMTSAQIADALGVPAGTVRYWLSQARRALAAELGRYDDQAEEA
jgi:RNA polymerase sigma-70 factor (ECF subfamily)